VKAESTNICEQAETFRLLLGMGLVSKSEIIAWADELIATRDNLPEWLLDVSLAANGDDDAIGSRLQDLPCEGDRMAAAHRAIERLAEAFGSGGIAGSAAARMLKRWAASAKLNQDDWTRAMRPVWVADEVEYGYATERDVVEAVTKCLDEFSAGRRRG
jgi:hypothetical protein